MAKTSVWLPADLQAEAKATGHPFSELIRRGVHASHPSTEEQRLRELIREELAPALAELTAIRESLATLTADPATPAKSGAARVIGNLPSMR